MKSVWWLALILLLVVVAGCSEDAAPTPPAATAVATVAATPTAIAEPTVTSVAEPTAAPTSDFPLLPPNPPVQTESGLIYIDVVVGTGTVAEAGKVVAVHYTGMLTIDNSVFDSSLERGQPFQFVLGVGQVIEGWDEGVAGMKVGGERHLIIPSELAYGERGFGDVIPPDSWLTFNVELLDVSEPP